MFAEFIRMRVSEMLLLKCKSDEPRMPEAERPLRCRIMSRAFEENCGSIPIANRRRGDRV